MSEKVSLLSLNIGNPSIERARKQCEWLKKRSDDIVVLTETKQSRGCDYIKEFFLQYGYDLFSMDAVFEYNVYAPVSKTGDLGVMIISRHPIRAGYQVFPDNSIYYARQVESVIDLSGKEVSIVGLYVPSRDRSDAKIRRKKVFLDAIKNYVRDSEKSNRIIMGDFNILDRNHVPHYSNFFDWEYDFYDALIKSDYRDAFISCHPGQQEHSWVGRTKNGYRYDYCLVSKELEKRILHCEYIHETRNLRLTDHSAIFVELQY